MHIEYKEIIDENNTFDETWKSDQKYKESVEDYISDHLAKKDLYLLSLIIDAQRWNNTVAINLQIVDRMDKKLKNDEKKI
jgi:hypothetical protein